LFHRAVSDQRSSDLEPIESEEEVPSPRANSAMAGTSSEGMPHRGDDHAGSLGLLCIRGANLGETLCEDSPLATSVPATPATEMQPQDHLRALDRKVFQRTPVPTMARARNGLATRTGSRVPTVNFHDATVVDLATRGEAFTMLESEKRFT